MQIASSAFRLLGIIAVFSGVFCGCSDDSGSTGSGVGGAQNVGTSTTGQGGASSNVAVGGASGTVNSSAGGSNGGSNSGGSPSSNCPTWPRSKLFPYLGPMFYGPDPGPCSSTQQTTGKSPVAFDYIYSEAGVLQEQIAREAQNTVEFYTYDENGYMVTKGDSFILYHYTYTDDTVTITSENEIRTYQLDKLGYPISMTSKNLTTGAVSMTAEFTYDGCQLTALTYKDENGAVLQDDSSGEITYDAQGHLARRVSVGGKRTVTYDYSCW